MQYQIRVGPVHRLRCCFGIRQIHLQQLVTLLSSSAELSQHLFNAGAIAGVAHLVEVEH